MKKSILSFLAAASFTATLSAQTTPNADPGIALSISSASVKQNADAILSATAGNFGSSTILANTLRIVIGVGTNAEIVGLAPGSDARWSIYSLSAGVGNTVILTNTGGGFASNDAGEILLTVQGATISSADLMLGNIVYIPKKNLALNGAPNALQGNMSIENDNSMTALEVSSTVDVPHVADALNCTIFPNPFMDVVRVVFDQSQTDATATIYSVDGKSLMTQKFNGNSAIINTNTLPSGMYMIHISNATSTFVQKLVKNK